MSTEHVVQPGEHLFGIARAFGFSTHLTIWNHPNNAELKKLRKNPNVLLAGDVVFIPDRETKQLDAPTEQKNTFAAANTDLHLRVKVLDALDKPRGEPCMLTGDGFQNQMFELTPGILEGLVPADAKKAEMFFANADKEESAVTVRLGVGDLDPVKEPSGQRQRLNNLGYFAGFDKRSSAQLKFAVEEFQCDHLKEIGKKKEDGICDEATQDVLRKVHGV
jgi:hypothetical protein